MSKWMYFLPCVLWLAACTENPTETIPEVKKVVVEEEKKPSVKLNVVRLEKELMKVKTSEDVEKFLRSHPRFCKEYLDLPQAYKEKLIINKFLSLYTNSSFLEWNGDVQNYYGDFSETQKQMEDAFSYIRFYYPKHYLPEINTIVTGFVFARDFSFSDTLIVISLDYLMHEKAKFKPPMDNYIVQRYDKPYLVAMMMLAISSKYNEHNPKDESMLATMIHFGKAHYFVERMMPGLADSLNIGYSGKEMKEVNKNLDVIWGHFIEKKLFFETNPKLIQKYCGETPKVLTIGDNCPGRIGRWLGWQIVRKYMEEHPEVTLQSLMKEKDANKIFKESKFKGKVK